LAGGGWILLIRRLAASPRLLFSLANPLILRPHTMSAKPKLVLSGCFEQTNTTCRQHHTGMNKINAFLGTNSCCPCSRSKLSGKRTLEDLCFGWILAILMTIIFVLVTVAHRGNDTTMTSFIQRPTHAINILHLFRTTLMV
jgi:hypothetical protein